MFSARPAKSAVLGVLGSALLVGASIIGVGQLPTAKADGCAAWNGVIMRGGGCDYDYQPDGSHMHCDAFFLWGIGGTNCFFVPAPPP